MKNYKQAIKRNQTVLTTDILDNAKTRLSANTNSASVIIPHVCNNINLFGAGFAGYLSSRYPIVKENFHMLGNQSKLGNVQYVKIARDSLSHNELIIANMIAQNKTINPNNRRPLNYEALVKCMVNVRNHVLDLRDNDLQVEIHCPKFGSGLAGGNWIFINNLIEDIWANIPVFVYDLKK